jgi:hypothetical protein
LMLPMAILLIFMLLKIVLRALWNVEGMPFKCAGQVFKCFRTGVQVPPDSCSSVPDKCSNVFGRAFKSRRILVQVISDFCSSVPDSVFKCGRIMHPILR